jgi:hypothetical protein
MDRPGDLPPIPGTETWGWPAIDVAIEECAPFPWWPRGQHPWLDAFVETDTHIIGIESKRYEPHRSSKTEKFSKAYWRPVWGEHMAPFEKMRDELAAGNVAFKHLDAVQLVKHAFGLRTEAVKRDKQPALVYLFAQPDAWPNGRPILRVTHELHESEAARFAEAVSGAEVAFAHCTYDTLLRTFEASPLAALRGHAAKVRETFKTLSPGRSKASTRPCAAAHTSLETDGG